MHNETLRPESTPSGLADFRPVVSDPTGRHAAGTLVDKYGRRITYVRLSITDRCDFRCTYCMAEEMTFLPRSEVLSLEEFLRLARVFVGLGVSKLRITGGEPLLDFPRLTGMIRRAKKLGIPFIRTGTNGFIFQRHEAPDFRDRMARMADELLLTSQRAEPYRLLSAGFRFTAPELRPALLAMLQRNG